jgi:hypothetical protein
MTLAEGVLDWKTSWYPLEDKVSVTVTFATKDAAVAFADEIAERFKN